MNVIVPKIFVSDFDVFSGDWNIAKINLVNNQSKTECDKDWKTVSLAMNGDTTWMGNRFFLCCFYFFMYAIYNICLYTYCIFVTLHCIRIDTYYRHVDANSANSTCQLKYDLVGRVSNSGHAISLSLH